MSAVNDVTYEPQYVDESPHTVTVSNVNGNFIITDPLYINGVLVPNTLQEFRDFVRDVDLRGLSSEEVFRLTQRQTILIDREYQENQEDLFKKQQRCRHVIHTEGREVVCTKCGKVMWKQP